MPTKQALKGSLKNCTLSVLLLSFKFSPSIAIAALLCSAFTQNISKAGELIFEDAFESESAVAPQKTPIDIKIEELAANNISLGTPEFEEKTTSDGEGKYQYFRDSSNNRSAIYWHSESGAHVLKDPFLSRWISRGAEQGDLGYPTKDFLRTDRFLNSIYGSTGIQLVFWNAFFQSGEMLMVTYIPTPTRPSAFPITPGVFYQVSGPIYFKWKDVGGLANYGFPVFIDSRNVGSGGTITGKYLYFSHHGLINAIYYYPTTGAHTVTARVLSKWRAMGGPTGSLSIPSTDTISLSDGKGEFNYFHNGAIFWHRDHGAHEMHGDIFKKWRALGNFDSNGNNRGFLGYPISDERKTPDNIGRYNVFKNGSIYWSPQTGAHEVHGDIKLKWADLGYERSVLGYPTSDEQDASGGGRISHFEHGSIRWRLISAPLTYFQQNMALLPPLPFVEDYKGTERDTALKALIENLKKERPDIAGFSEIFVDDERKKLKRDLASIYPYSHEGPDEAGTDQDGGLLLLSRHNITKKQQSIYRICLEEDCLSDKGVLHARIDVPGHPTDYDIFLSHLQNPNPRGGTAVDIACIFKGCDEGPGSTGQDKVKFQVSHLATFLQANRTPFGTATRNPTLAMGDYNTDARNSDLYADMNRRLHFNEDLWLTSGNTSQSPFGVTSQDPVNTFRGGITRMPIDSQRHQSGTRIDYFLSWKGDSYWPSYRDTNVVVWQSSPGRDISDHYGLRTKQVHLRELDVSVDRRINRVKISVLKAHCLDTTAGAGADEINFFLRYETVDGLSPGSTREERTSFNIGDVKHYSYPDELDSSDIKLLSVNDPGPWLNIMVDAVEYDSPWTDQFDETFIKFSREELLSFLGKTVEFTAPVLYDENGDAEYVVTVAVKVE